MTNFTIKDKDENDHWKARFNERGNLDIDEPEIKEMLFAEIKNILKKYPGSVQQSATHEDRIVVTGKDGLHYVMQKKKSRKDNKTVYIPITVLAPNMYF